MARYGKAAAKKVAKALHQQKRGELKSRSGDTVKTREQAIAIALSEARRAGGKVPAQKKPKTATRKPPTKKTARKATAKGKAAPAAPRKRIARKTRRKT